MVKKKSDTPVFEIIVVLAIVAIVAITGQVMLHYEGKAGTGFGGDQITGAVIGTYEEEVVEEDFIDISIENIQVNPPSPLVGEPFEIRIIIANKGLTEINIPFYVEAELTPFGENVKPTVVNSVMTQILAPEEKSAAVFKIAAVTKEGPMKILATADSTSKINDDNPSNDQRSKTVILTIE